ncbi:sugar ABC transporter substrate-binding protein [Alsobacter metallidurans]|uniref:Sugar ABC transporter substrate-binding protein n=1 Tax=Alsobacter metallidurans TaxID=340221 RepID=A0A917I9G4_9HYPH|nr:substrate-binding domain-containing protein [Alsobacter metallidurans]GGH29183.1 sugar ABC transporter substrate-binding protein [Alsobacter metallidurans]
MLKHIIAGVAGAGLLAAAAAPANADAIADANAFVATFAGRATKWDGPTTGPKGAAGKTIVVLAADMKNGGVLGVSNGVSEAAKALGWTVRVLDGAGSISGRTAAFGQAMALKPDGIVINGFDAVEQKAGIEAAGAAKIPLVSWHAAPVIGPVPGTPVRVNVSTDAMDVSRAAALWAFADAGGKPGVVIFTDSTYAIAIAKANKIRDVITAAGGTVLEYVDTPIADTSTRMPQLTTSLLQRHGAKWTHALAINDIYFDFMGPSLASAGIKGDGAPKAVAAGDGSESAYQRIRSGQYQAVTVAEPLNLQGWQLVDELNRAFAGEAWSGYTPPLHVVTKSNVEFDGGPKNAFDPDNGYRDAYKAIWGK